MSSRSARCDTFEPAGPRRPFRLSILRLARAGACARAAARFRGGSCGATPTRTGHPRATTSTALRLRYATRGGHGGDDAAGPTRLVPAAMAAADRRRAEHRSGGRVGAPCLAHPRGDARARRGGVPAVAAARGLSESLVDPALGVCRAARRARSALARRLKALGSAGGSVTELMFDDGARRAAPRGQRDPRGAGRGRRAARPRPYRAR